MITFICYRIKSLIESLSTISYFLSYICLEYSTIVEDMWDCPNNITVNTEPGERFAHVYWTVPTVPDGYTQISDHEPGSEFPIGSTQVHYYLAQDSSTDHRLACEFKVTILGKCCFYVIQYICVVIWAYIVHIRLVKVCGLAWSCLETTTEIWKIPHYSRVNGIVTWLRVTIEWQLKITFLSSCSNHIILKTLCTWSMRIKTFVFVRHSGLRHFWIRQDYHVLPTMHFASIGISCIGITENSYQFCI